MRVNIVGKSRPPLPRPPFVLHLSSINMRHKFLDAYPEIEENFQWNSGRSLREDKSGGDLYLFFRDNGKATHADDNCRPEWPIVEW